MKKIIAVCLLVILIGCGGRQIISTPVFPDPPVQSAQSKLIATVNPNADCQFVEALYLWSLPILMVKDIQQAVEKVGGNAYKITNTQVKKSPMRDLPNGVDVNFEAYKCKF